jgi:UDP-glucose 4-epimerase
VEKVLVPGGAGFYRFTCGRRAVSSGDLRAGAERSILRPPRQNLPLAHPKLEFVEGDIREPSAVNSAMCDVSHCLHLAAQVLVTHSLEHPRASAERNVLWFVTILEAARAAGVKRFVYASSAAVYGDPHVLPLTEDVDLKPLSRPTAWRS